MGEVVAIWIVADIGYYLLLPSLGIGSVHSSHPFVLTAYYLAWIGVALGNFWDVYGTWDILDISVSTAASLLLVGICVGLYLLYIFPLFPAIHWANALQPPTELLSASRWYFLPKSIEIILQQLLVLAMVLAFSAEKLALKTISYLTSFLFGGIHLFLVFGGATTAYVTVFTLSALIAGYVYPYLLLRVRNGFIYSFFMHWGFYALVMVLARVLRVA